MNAIIVALFVLLPASAYAKALKVVTSTQTIAHLVEVIGGESVQVEHLSRGTEDPHYIEAKPSFMVKVRDADLVVMVGLELESAWMDSVIAGSRNPKVMPGGPGHLALGRHVSALEKVNGPLDRGQGDVHPMGNPHFYLDPVRVHEILPIITDKLIELRPSDKLALQARHKKLSNELLKKNQTWIARVRKLRTKNVITYHRTLVYFADRFQLNIKATIEPKPGIPPTVQHSMELIQLARQENIKCILNESHFETIAAQKIAKEINGTLAVVPTEVGALPGTESYIALIEKIITSLETCK